MRNQELIPGISSRRFACDRCRGMKLRCMRGGSDQEMRCDRCLQVDIECVTSPTFRVREYRVEDDANQPKSRKRRRQCDYLSQQSHPKPFVAINGVSTSALNTGSIAMESFSKPNITPSSEGTLPCLSSWDSSMKSVAAALAWSATVPATPDSWDTESLNLHHTHFDDNTNQALASFDITADIPIGNQTPISLAPSPKAQTENNTQERTSQQATLPSHDSEKPTKSVTSESSHDLSVRNLGYQNGYSNQETCMHRLSQLNLDLVRQLSQFDKDQHNVTLGMLMSPMGRSYSSDETSVDSILGCTHQFLDILNHLSSSLQTSPTKDPAHWSYSRSQASELYLRPFGFSNSSLMNEDSFPSSLGHNGSPISQQELAFNEICEIKLDSATLLLVLTCYMHILRLFVTLFAHMQALLERVSKSDEPYLSPIAAFDFNNIPLQSGNLQVVMFIQIVTNMLERVEILMGLPRDLRISVREDECVGLLRDDENFEFAKAIIGKEELGKSQFGKGGIKSLRSNIRRAKQLLRESIAP